MTTRHVRKGQAIENSNCGFNANSYCHLYSVEVLIWTPNKFRKRVVKYNGNHSWLL